MPRNAIRVAKISRAVTMRRCPDLPFLVDPSVAMVASLTGNWQTGARIP